MAEHKNKTKRRNPPTVEYWSNVDRSQPGYISPGARKEKLRQRTYATPHRTTKNSVPYVELRTASAFSFLDGASLPEDLVQRAAMLDLPAVALLDRNGVYGAPRFYQAAKQAGIKAIVGADVVMDSIHPDNHKETQLSILVANRQGYRNLCRLLTAAARDRPKGEARLSWETLELHTQGLHCLTGSDEGLLAQTLENLGVDEARRQLERLVSIFDGRVHIELQRHHLRHQEYRNLALVGLAKRLELPLVATNGVRYAGPGDKQLHDILTCIRNHTHLDAAGRLLAAQRERHLKSTAEMCRQFADIPQALHGSFELAQQLDFTLADLGYRFPDYPLPPGETPASYLRHITWN